MIRVLLADDHALVREGLAQLLRSAGYCVVGQAADGLTALRLAETLDPDVLVVDWSMPTFNGAEVVRRLAAAGVRARCLLLSMHREEAFVTEALRLGACGYALKDDPGEEFLRAVATVSSGRRYLAPDLADRAIASYGSIQCAGIPDPLAHLSDREREVIVLAAGGRSASEVGRALFISARTAETHRASALRTLGLVSQTDLVRWAIRNGILAA